jgi:single-stranded DNA-binding protein
MDLNLVVLCGQLATDAEVRVFDSGTRLIRYLVVLRVGHPRKRTDVIPVTLWKPGDELAAEPGVKGDRVWVCGAVQRRYWESPDGRRSRVEVIAEQVSFKVDDLEPVGAE